MRIAMLVRSGVAYFVNDAIAKARFANASQMNFESPLTSLVWITSIVSIVMTFIISYFIIPDLDGDTTQWWKLATIISCGTLAGAVIPELVKVFTSTESRHVREVVASARRRRRVAGHFVRLRGRQLLGVLHGPRDGGC